MRNQKEILKIIPKNGIVANKGKVYVELQHAVADLRGARGTRTPPPEGPSSFNFMQFLGKFGKIVCWRPPGPLLGEILDPPLTWSVVLLSDHINFIQLISFLFKISIQTFRRRWLLEMEGLTAALRLAT